MAATDSLPLSRRTGITVESALLFSSWTLGSLLLSLIVWILVPTLLLGWTPLVISSGSMNPLIRTGDVVLVDPGFGPPGPGSVVAFESESSVVVHRVVDVSPEGSIITRGDANRAIDSTPVVQEQLLGTGRLLVPYVGLLRIIGWAWLAVLTALGVAAITLWVRRPVAATSITAVVVCLALVAVATSVFTTATGNEGSSLTAIDVAPPTNLTATCGLIGAGSVNVSLTWTASPTAGLTSYRILHDGPGGGTNFTEVGSVSPTSTSFTHQIPTAIVSLGTHTYTVQSALGTWESENSNTDAVSVTQIVIIFACTAA